MVTQIWSGRVGEAWVPGHIGLTVYAEKPNEVQVSEFADVGNVQARFIRYMSPEQARAIADKLNEAAEFMEKREAAQWQLALDVQP